MPVENERLEVSWVEDRYLLVSVAGNMDREMARELERAIGDGANRGLVGVIVELPGARSLGPGALASLLKARRRLLALGGELTIVGDPRLLGLHGLLPTADTVEEASATEPFDVTRPALVDEVAPLRLAVTGWAARAGASRRTLDSLALAASEAITNAVVHAYREGDSPGTVTVRGELAGSGRVHLEISDQGGGMYPRPDSPGLGLGLPLISQLAENVEIDSHRGAGTRIAMDFPLLSAC